MQDQKKKKTAPVKERTTEDTSDGWISLSDVIDEITELDLTAMESKQEKEAESIKAALAEIERELGELDDLKKSGLFAVNNNQSAG